MAAHATEAKPDKADRRYYNWPAIHAAYVEGIPSDDAAGRRWPTYAEVARLFGVGADRCRQKGAEQGWTQQRTAYQARLAARREQVHGDELAELLGGMDRDVLDTASVALAAVGEQVRRLIFSAQDPRVVLDPDMLDKLAASARKWHALALSAGGRPVGYPLGEGHTSDDPTLLRILDSVAAHSETYLQGVADGRATVGATAG